MRESVHEIARGRSRKLDNFLTGPPASDTVFQNTAQDRLKFVIHAMGRNLAVDGEARLGPEVGIRNGGASGRAIRRERLGNGAASD
jgi:hypothetical protein